MVLLESCKVIEALLLAFCAAADIVYSLIRYVKMYRIRSVVCFPASVLSWVN